MGNNNDGTRHRPQQPQEPEPHHPALAIIPPRTRRRRKQQQRQSPLHVRVQDFSKLLSFFVFGFVLFQLLQTLVAVFTTSSLWSFTSSPLPQRPAFPRVLVGIFTTDDLLESKRRQVLRKTYLSYYKSSSSDTKNRICSLQEFLLKTSTTSHHLNLQQDKKECQLIYAFVLGTNTTTTSTNTSTTQDGTKDKIYPKQRRYDLVEPFIRGELDPSELGRFVNASMLTNADPNESSSEHNDLVLLNISENMNQGKSESWFLYATQLWKEHMEKNNKNMDNNPSSSSQLLLPIDYIAKCDSDTLLFPEIFLDQLLDHRHLPSHPKNAYFAGSRYSTTRRKGRYFLAGGCYLLSWELSNYVTSPDCPRTELYLGTEDKSMGNYIWSYQQHTDNNNNIQTINVLPKGVEWMAHGTKDPIRLQELWNRRYDTRQTRHHKT
jgi:hypothetical protein